MDPLRRRLLQRATALGAAAFLRPAFAAAVATAKFKSYPFEAGKPDLQKA